MKIDLLEKEAQRKQERQELELVTRPPKSLPFPRRQDVSFACPIVHCHLIVIMMVTVFDRLKMFTRVFKLLSSYQKEAVNRQLSFFHHRPVPNKGISVICFVPSCTIWRALGITDFWHWFEGVEV